MEGVKRLKRALIAPSKGDKAVTMTTMGGRSLFAPSAAASRSGGAVSVSSSRRRDGRHAGSGGRSVDTGRCNARPTVATMDVRGEYERSSFDGDDVWSDEAKPGIGAEYGDTGFGTRPKRLFLYPVYELERADLFLLFFPTSPHPLKSRLSLLGRHPGGRGAAQRAPRGQGRRPDQALWDRPR